MAHGFVKRRNTFSIKTLGCKLNQYESECIRYNLEKMGFEFREFYDVADFYIINTCTVTAKTDSRSRNAIRRARRKSDDSVIVATGCYAERIPEYLDKMKELDYVIGNENKNKIPYLLKKLRDENIDKKISFEKVIRNKTSLESLIDKFHGHSRAFVMIQEGCDAFCSYCIVPYTRGRSRSLEPSRVIEQIKKLENNGYHEIVLTGIHAGRYGENSNYSTDLAALIKMILDSTEDLRIRLSSLEPMEINDELIKLVSGTDRVASHFHVPLQSGDDSILKAMKRPYTVQQYIETTTRIAELIPDVLIGADVIVGFPGESDKQFNNTYGLIESKLPVNFLHVFSYSDRPGTASESFRGKVPPGTIKDRTRKLIELGDIKRREFEMLQIGRDEIALLQDELKSGNNLLKSITGNYCEVIVEAPVSLKGKLAPVSITDFRNGNLYGKLKCESLLGK